MWKAFNELQEMGWIPADVVLPKMICVQSTGCAPIVKAWSEGKEHAPVWQNAATAASGIRVPVAVGDFLIIRAVRESGGWCTAVDDEDILVRCAAFVVSRACFCDSRLTRSMAGPILQCVPADHRKPSLQATAEECAKTEGLLLCPEGAATLVAYKQALASGQISSSANVVLFNCATGLKYPMAPVTTSVDQHGPINFQTLASGAPHTAAAAAAAAASPTAPTAAMPPASAGASLTGAAGAMCAGAAFVGAASVLAKRLVG